MNYLKIIDETIADGPGIRSAIYLAGCENRCKGCHNPESWPYEAGKALTDEVIAEFVSRYKANPLLDGVSVLGGDPFAPRNRQGLLHLLQQLTGNDINDIWVWTGYLYEELLEDKTAAECLKYVKCLVDGPFIEVQKDVSLEYRGSKNQRVIALKQ